MKIPQYNISNKVYIYMAIFLLFLVVLILLQKQLEKIIYGGYTKREWINYLTNEFYRDWTEGMSGWLLETGAVDELIKRELEQNGKELSKSEALKRLLEWYWGNYADITSVNQWNDNTDEIGWGHVRFIDYVRKKGVNIKDYPVIWELYKYV